MELITNAPPMPKRHRSKQDYATPSAFIRAVETRFEPLQVDLAAHEANHVTPAYLGPGGLLGDSLAPPCDWNKLPGSALWLNPPFGNIAPWARKCSDTTRSPGSECRIYFLVPASIGANWFADHVFPVAHVVALQGRLSFDGKNPFPKDCMLCVFGIERGFSVWDWRKDA